MSTAETNNKPEENIQLEGGAYDIIRKRLTKQGEVLREKMLALNTNRKDIFGSIETKLISTERITTTNNCQPRDIIAIGQNRFLFGYNVHIGLKSETFIQDVFALYQFDREAYTFTEEVLDAFQDATFLLDFSNLYKYYRHTVFVKFMEIGPYLHMVFRIGKSVTDVKTFKWLNQDGVLTYEGNRSEHEYKYPNQHQFSWTKVGREHHVAGRHPHITIEDLVFVETIGGDLTLKVENNTETGKGIYSEEVKNKDQTLDDADIYYARIGNIVLLKIRPYQEDLYRYIIYNHKIQEAQRVDAIQDACILLPNDQGIIFPKGYYINTGEFKLFDHQLDSMLFERRVQAANGEDYLYVFYNRASGTYFLLSYNIITQKVDTPIICNGFTLFKDGELALFKSEEEPQKHHSIQIWQTAYAQNMVVESVDSNAYLHKVGNKEIVLALSECQELVTLIYKEDSFANLYIDIVKKSTDIIDSYHWLSHDEAQSLNVQLEEVKQTASNAIDEFDKILKLKRSAKEQTEEVEKRALALLSKSKNMRVAQVNDSVHLLAELRHVKGEIIGLETIRFVDTNKIAALNEQITEALNHASENCVNFLLRPEALDPYKSKVASIEKELETLDKVVVANDLEKEIEALSKELELLIEIVSNLKILDATKTTQIIDSITALFAAFNQINAALRQKRKSLMLVEGKAEFNAQIRLVNQGFINYLDIANSPEKTGEYLNKLVVQLEELEGKFADFDEYLVQIEEKREEIYNAFESKKIALIEASNKKAQSLMASADRILNGIQNRAASFKTNVDINGYFASDLMVDKVRDIIKNLISLNDSNKADDLQSKLKTVKDDALRQLNDKNDLFVDGGSTIKFGNHQFLVNTQKLDVTTVLKGEDLFFHLTGTNFYERIQDDLLEQSRPVWNQNLISENQHVYRAEFLAFQLFTGLTSKANGILNWSQLTEVQQLEEVQTFSSKRFNEGYVKGVHDHDALAIITELVRKEETIGLLKYAPQERVNGLLFWEYLLDDEVKNRLRHQLKSFGLLRSVFKEKSNHHFLVHQLYDLIKEIESRLPYKGNIDRSVHYLLEELCESDKLVISPRAKDLAEQFYVYLNAQRKTKIFQTAVFVNEGHWDDRFNLILLWLRAYSEVKEVDLDEDVIAEAAFYLLINANERFYVSSGTVLGSLTGLKGDHEIIQDGNYNFHYNLFMTKLLTFQENEVQWFTQYNESKKRLTHLFKEDIRLTEYLPRVLSSFVRNRLIDKVYLSLIGDNLAKQIGAAGVNKRTDLMGMLLLISPPGYGKTTLMEYVASRLGLIFMKINGPALGHHIVSLDPQDADNAASREEVEKLNLAFEMGDNVMLYLDDIQHCNPEFLQKFISLADGQRKIEGVYKGKSKTYDFRGKKMVVVMAGNPYTESGDKFRIPDMLANRADIYNLGDILGDTAEEFKLSYIENSLTSNSVLATLTDKGKRDIYSLVQVAEGLPIEQMQLTGSYSSEELQDIQKTLKMALTVRDVLLKVNLEYIDSAGKEDQYRTEPAFKLQGSYRDMNKMVEKINPFMNAEELQTLLLSHYQNEAQTLTTGAESNLLKLKELIGLINEQEQERWDMIKANYREQQKLKGYGDNGGEMIQVIDKMEAINATLANLNPVDSKEEYVIQLKAITEGVRAISKVMIENRKGKSPNKN